MFGKGFEGQWPDGARSLNAKVEKMDMAGIPKRD